MNIEEREHRLTTTLAWGAIAVTLLVTDRINTDPVNVSKMLLLSVVAFSLIPFVIENTKEMAIYNKVLLSALFIFILSLAISIFTSSNVLERGLYGAFSRNTGFLTYLGLVMLFIAATSLSTDRNFSRIINALMIAGVVNVVYCLFVSFGYDFFTWNNPYKSVLGTFGNPNFIGAFMGIFFTLLIVQVLNPDNRLKSKIITILLIPPTIYVIHLSSALQGILVSAFGLLFTIFFLLRSQKKFFNLSWIYLCLLSGGSLVAFLGIIQKGPLANFLYKPSITFRGEYWKAAINMGMDNPILGVGIDSYGIFFKTYRELSATVSPGLDVITDTAHNVFLDIFAGTGFPGLISYLAINIIILITGLMYLQKFRQFDAKFLSLFLTWAAYQLQSIVSINQIGLAIWGWLLGASVIAYVRTHPNGPILTNRFEKKGKVKEKKREIQNNELVDASIVLKMTAGAIIGLLVALPPYIADVKLRQISSGNGTVDGIVALGNAWPADMIRLNKLIITLANNNENGAARELAALGALKFPNDFTSWYALYELTLDGTPEKEAIKKKLHQIDPFNPKYFD